MVGSPGMRLPTGFLTCRPASLRAKPWDPEYVGLPTGPVLSAHAGGVGVAQPSIGSSSIRISAIMGPHPNLSPAPAAPPAEWPVLPPSRNCPSPMSSPRCCGCWGQPCWQLGLWAQVSWALPQAHQASWQSASQTRPGNSKHLSAAWPLPAWLLGTWGCGEQPHPAAVMPFMGMSA